MKYYRYNFLGEDAIILDKGSSFQYKYITIGRFSNEWRYHNTSFDIEYYQDKLTEITKEEFFLECL